MTYFPIFKGDHALRQSGAGDRRSNSSPVTVIADPSECSFQFKLTGTETFTTSCDIAKSALVARSVNYDNQDGAEGHRGAGQDRRADHPGQHAELRDGARPGDHRARLPGRGRYVNQINYPMTVLLLTILVVYVTLVYAPIAAWLVELFPTRIRYSGLSLPYHIGNGWFGGFLPAIVFAIVAATGNIYSGLWYPIVIASMSLVVGLLFLPETKDVDITQRDVGGRPIAPHLSSSPASRPSVWGAGLKTGNDHFGCEPRLLPAHAALLEAERGQQRRQPDRRADPFHHRHAELLGQPLRLHLHRALRDALRDDHVGAVLLDQRARGHQERLDHLVRCRRCAARRSPRRAGRR